MTVRDEITGARTLIHRRLTWAETDATGHHHFSAAVRWLEEGEHELFYRLGLGAMVPTLPRVNMHVDFRGRIWFGAELTVEVGVIALTRSTATFATEVREGDEVKIECRHTVVHAPDPTGGSVPWSEDVRALLTAPEIVPVREPAGALHP
ncbi:acyl-CoA thioesterase [Granulicoccus sp. GXG6511]|uniref:acyl-CoA thioesterase n=1 Tax=Granulicoccus sp. GXG6511 TaxID=3381351 RepID=UPI003D7CDDF6